MNLGLILRNERKKRKLTLKVVAEKAGISQGFLSQIENDVNSPSVDTLVNICGAIGLEPSQVLRQVERQERIVVIRRREWKEVEFPPSGFVTRRFFSPQNRRIIDSSVLVIEPGGTIPVRKKIKNSQEALCILQGSVELTHGAELFELSRGDCAHFWSQPDSQQITNKTGSPAVVFWVGTL